MFERHFKNEDSIKALIVDGHKRGVCDSNGGSAKVTDATGRQMYIAKPKFSPSSAVSVYVCRDGVMVPRE